MDDRFENTQADLAEVEDRLREARPTATGAELDEARLRARARALRRSPSRLAGLGSVFTRSRMAITAVLVSGLLFSGAGATLAVSGMSSSGSAGTAQYLGAQGTPNQTLGVTEQGPGESPGEEEVLGEGENGEGEVRGVEEERVQAARQVEADDGKKLPFTGLLAIPLLMAGGGMLIAGFILRRRVPAVPGRTA